MFSMSTSKLVKVCLTTFPPFSCTFGMTTRLPLRRFSLRKIVYPESLHVLIRLSYLEGPEMDANCYFCSVALVSTIV